MDIAALSTAFSQSKIQQQASISVMKMAMNNAKVSGDAVTQLMESTKALEQSVNPNAGTNIDVKL